MRSIWNGAVTFGLVSVPVKLYSATEEHDAPLHQVHAADQGRIRYKRTCEVCGKEIPYKDIARAFEEDGQSVILTDDELSHLPAETNREIEVIEFVPMSEVDSIRMSKSYFLEPASKSAKTYVLLRKALEESDRTAIVRVTLRNKSRLAALRPCGEFLLLQTLLWDDEIRSPDFAGVNAGVKISAQEMELSAQLVKSLSRHFEPSEFKDEYQSQLHALIENKLKKGDTIRTPEAPAVEGTGDAKVIDLMEALRRSDAQSNEREKALPQRSQAPKKLRQRRLPKKLQQRPRQARRPSGQHPNA